MSARRLSQNQPDGFAFTAENLEWAGKETAKYPPGQERSAVISLLWRAQKQNGGWVSEPAMRVIADMLGMAYIRVYEVATFYTMFNLKAIGRFHVQLCGTTPCWLRGADDLKQVCAELIGVEGGTSEDGMFTWTEVECLGACVNAPVVQIDEDYYEDLSADDLRKLIEDLRRGRAPEAGSARGRTSSEPEGGAGTLTDQGIYDPQVVAAPVDLKTRGAKLSGQGAS